LLANAIRQNRKITGFKINEQEFKIVQFADDTCVFVEDIEGLKHAFVTLDEFAICAGLKANRDKTQAIGIGASSNYRHMADKTLDIKWPESSIKFLGVLINNDTEKMQNENIQAKLEKIQELVNSWCLRKMTLKGKATVIILY
jgi:hypothetical protein